MDLRDNDAPLCGLYPLVHITQHLHACRVDRWDVSHANDEHSWHSPQRLNGTGECFGSTKEEGTIHFVDLHISSDIELCEFLWKLDVCIFNLACNDTDRRYRSHAMHKEKRREYHADLYRYGKIDNDGKNKSREKHDHVALWRAKQDLKATPFAHVIRNDHQNSGQTGQRYHRNERAERQKDTEKCNRMDHACNRCSSATFNIGCCTSDRTRSRNASE